MWLIDVKLYRRPTSAQTLKTERRRRFAQRMLQVVEKFRLETRLNTFLFRVDRTRNQSQQTFARSGQQFTSVLNYSCCDVVIHWQIDMVVTVCQQQSNRKYLHNERQHICMSCCCNRYFTEILYMSEVNEIVMLIVIHQRYRRFQPQVNFRYVGFYQQAVAIL